jgi:hypothetical protein
MLPSHPGAARIEPLIRPTPGRYTGGVPTDFQYKPNKGVDHSHIQESHKASNSKVHNRRLAHCIHKRENYEQWRNDLSGILIYFGHVLRPNKPLQDMISSNYFSVG